MAIFNRAACCALMGLVALCSAHAAEADPITLLFRADITRQCSDPTCQAVEFSVPVTIRFDPAEGEIFDLGWRQVRSYGTPSVTIPLPSQGQPGTIPDPYRTFIAEGRVLFQSGVWIHDTQIAVTEVFEGKFDPDNPENEAPVVAWQFFMDKQVFESAKPTLFLSDYLKFLGRGPLEFNYIFRTPNPQGSYAGTGYSGTATLLTEPQSVPEPTSLLLLASGLGALGTGAWRRKRRSLT